MSEFEVLDPRFSKLVIRHAKLERLWTGARWVEGPAYFPAGRFLVFSDIPNDRLMRYDETSGAVSVFREPSGNTNGNSVDLEGRLVSCEHKGRRITHTQHDGSVVALATHFENKRLNSPNDIVVKRSDLRHRWRIRGRRRAVRARAIERIPPRPTHQHARRGRDRSRAAQWACLLAR